MLACKRGLVLGPSDVPVDQRPVGFIDIDVDIQAAEFLLDLLRTHPPGIDKDCLR